jgi:DNA-binding transcriptional MerR regulator
VGGLAIGKLAALSGTKVPTIRFYESIGLLPPPDRSSGGQRRYERATLERLSLIRHARESGFNTEEIRGLLDLYADPDAPCNGVTDLASALLDRNDARIKRLKTLRRTLQSTISQCSGPRISNCAIMRTLADREPKRRAGRTS